MRMTINFDSSNQLTTAAANLSTRAIVVTQHRVCRTIALLDDPVFIPVSSVNFTPRTRRALSTQRRAHGMTNVVPTTNVAAQQIIFKAIKSILRVRWIVFEDAIYMSATGSLLVVFFFSQKSSRTLSLKILNSECNLLISKFLVFNDFRFLFYVAEDFEEYLSNSSRNLRRLKILIAILEL